MEQNWAIIINPKSGKRQYRRQRNYLFRTLKQADIEFKYSVTKFAGHATLIARHYAHEGFQNFVILGGDGTISEVINGLMSAKIPDTTKLTVAIVPSGTGNDWARFWNLSTDYKHSIDIFLKGKIRRIDIGKVDFELESEKQTHYFINSIGFGLDGTVNHLAHHLKRYTGSNPFLYLIALLGAIFTYKARKATISSPEHSFCKSMFTMNIANGCYSGGGMKQNPNALPYDGLLDVMIAGRPSFYDIISALRLIFNGKLLNHPIIESYQTHTISVNCHEKVQVEADGITLNGSSPYEVSIIPNAIQMIVP